MFNSHYTQKGDVSVRYIMEIYTSICIYLNIQFHFLIVNSLLIKQYLSTLTFFYNLESLCLNHDIGIFD